MKRVEMPIGMHKGTSVSLTPTNYLLWFLSVTSLRQKYPWVSRKMIQVLHDRFEDSDQVEAMVEPDYCDLI